LRRRGLVYVALAQLAASSALAASSERDRVWDQLIAEAKKHGGEETQYKTSVSYVFRKPEGEFVTFTKMLDSPTRAVCLLSKDQTVTVCENWDTEKLRYGWRGDANSPWSYGDDPPNGEKKSGFASLLAQFGDIIGMGLKAKGLGGTRN
jgi:hypothetical protein